MIPSVALALMVKETSLSFVQDDETGAFAVTRSETPNPILIPNNTSDAAETSKYLNEKTKSVKTNQMNKKSRNIGGLFKGLLSLALASGTSELSAQEDNSDIEDEVFVLSPFSVDASGDDGYRSTSTLAGTRLKTDLRDVGSAISVMTREVFDDTGATDAATALSYGLSTEVGGEQGNYAGGGNQTNVRIRPQGRQRVRGLGSAVLTRNYFLTDIPFDSYNVERATINRGPNSLLFGLGNPGGVIDNSVLRASSSRDFGQIQFRLGERHSSRVSIDYNKSIIEGRFGIRVAALREDRNFKQDPAYEDDERLFAAFNAVLFEGSDGFLGSTVLRGNVESGEIRSNRPSITPPVDGITPWFNAPRLQDKDGNPIVSGQYDTEFEDWVLEDRFVPKYTINYLDGDKFPNRATSLNKIDAAPGIPYFIQLGLWYTDPNAQVPNVGLGGSDSDINGVESRFFWKSNPVYGRRELYNSSYFNPGAGFTDPRIDPASGIWDNANRLLSGNTHLVVEDFTAYNVALEQSLFGDRAGLEIVFDEQTYDTHRRTPFSDPELTIDINEFIGEDQPNPNLGRFWVKENSLGSFTNQEVDNSAFRATGFYTMDFSDVGDSLGNWLGKHTVTGFYSEHQRDDISRSVTPKWDSQTVEIQRVLNGNLAAFRRNVRSVVHLGDSLIGPSIGLDDVQLTDTINVGIPQEGDNYRFIYWDPNSYEIERDDFQVLNVLTSGDIGRAITESKVASMQSSFLGGDLVTLYGWREDDRDQWDRLANGRLDSGEWDGEGNLVLKPALAPGDPAPEATQTRTFSAVYHFSEDKLFELPFNSDLSFHYNESQNASVSSVRRDVTGQVIGPPNGETKEYGLTVELLDRDLSIKVNWFETTAGAANLGFINSSIGLMQTWTRWWNDGLTADVPIETANTFGGDEWSGAFSSYQDAFDTFNSWVPEPTRSLVNNRIENGVQTSDPIEGLSSTRDIVAEGFEVEMVGRFTDNWTISANVSKTETINSNSMPVLQHTIREIEQNIRNTMVNGMSMWDMNDSPIIGDPSTFGSRYAGVLETMNSRLARDGTLSLEQREWRINATTRYDFKEESFLNGLSVGGSVRYQSKAAVGYPLIRPDGILIPDLEGAFFGPAEINGDLMASYTRQLAGDKTWKIQLNIRNAFGDDDPIPVTINPDGFVAVYRNPNPGEVTITNTISF